MSFDAGVSEPRLPPRHSSRPALTSHSNHEATPCALQKRTVLVCLSLKGHGLRGSACKAGWPPTPRPGVPHIHNPCLWKLSARIPCGCGRATGQFRGAARSRLALRGYGRWHRYHRSLTSDPNLSDLKVPSFCSVRGFREQESGKGTAGIFLCCTTYEAAAERLTGGGGWTAEGQGHLRARSSWHIPRAGGSVDAGLWTRRLPGGSACHRTSSQRGWPTGPTANRAAGPSRCKYSRGQGLSRITFRDNLAGQTASLPQR